VTPEGSDGLVVDTEVRRGDFKLTVALAVAPGEVLGVLGPNGAGKSTLLSALAGLTPVAVGRIVLAGQVVDDAGTGAFVEAAGRPVGFVFQNYRLFPHLSVLENVAFSPRARGMGRRAARSAASHWLDRLGLTEFADRKPGSLSGGEKQRVALARALAARPALLFADEPTGNLDSKTAAIVADLMFDLVAEVGAALVMVTHDPVLAERADRIVRMGDGKIVS
jgi:molybdate transport system ATP-binding protein